MKYYIIEEQQGSSIPIIVNWYDKLDVRKINKEQHINLPEIIILDIKLGVDAVYPDMLFFPFLLVSKEVMEIIRMYDETIPYHSIVLNDLGETGGRVYCLPILDEFINEEQLWRNNIIIYFKSENNKKKIHIRTDLLESLLFREITGIKIREV